MNKQTRIEQNSLEYIGTLGKSRYCRDIDNKLNADWEVFTSK